MTAFDTWARFGFSANPYSEQTLSPNENGHVLLTGRDSEIGKIQRRIGSKGTHPSIEGPVGAGKTSLLNVATYRMMRHCLDVKDSYLFVPAKQRFQPNADPDEFVRYLFEVVAQTLLEHVDHVEAVGLPRPNLDLLDNWLNDPEYGGWQAGGGAAILSMSYGRTTEPNTGDGFARSGFPEAVLNALAEAFPDGSGGIVCVLDNLEILETTGAARQSLEELRDRVFNIPQLRWVLCGSRGIVSRARSERLSGIFQAPTIVGRLADEDAVEAVRRRIEHFGSPGAIAPVTPEGFDFLYRALNMNMRESLAHAQEFSHWIDETFPDNADMPIASQRDQLLRVWLAERAARAFEDAGSVQPRHWQFFEELCEAGGRTGSADFNQFAFARQQQMVAAVTALDSANLMGREVDPDNGSRTVNKVTSLGWLVHFHRTNYVIPRPRPRS